MDQPAHKLRGSVTTLVFCVSALLALGLVMLYSAGMSGKGPQLLLRQMAWGTLGLMGCVSMAALDYSVLRKAAWPIYLVSVALLGVVLVVGDPINGARRWLGYEGFRVQPSEFAKFGLILLLAWHCERNMRHMHDLRRGILQPALLIGVVLGLVFVEPDRGTTILLAGVSAVMLIVAGVRWSHLLPPAVAGAGGLAFLLIQDPMRLRRILAWLHPEEHREGAGFQAYQGMIALGSGGLEGLGLGNGRQKLGFIPEHHTDFIFSVIGEELGLVATLGVLVAFCLIVLCGVRIALRARDAFGMLVGCGVTFLIGFQAFINIGVVTSVLPNKGISLPFISYGGSNLVLMLTSVGVLLSIARQAVPNASPNLFEAKALPAAQAS
ncbi:MAG: putative lipid II flippase FtsW [Verrucomicrobia bacterium]|jgi:cell division protein FtsW|nr:putative lipid II flippase FtsW [Verrucomicrobiota bacterium]